MAFWHRINRSKLQIISNQYRRFYIQSPYASSLHQTRISVLEIPFCSIDKKPSYFYTDVRFFAAPVQAIKNKKEEPRKDGLRLNEQITARVVRLVTVEGDHSIISIHAALEHARKLDLDLVEVQRNANPPVCKLMDFHQKRYKQRVKEKDQAKRKSGETLKKGECKEVRFTEKIEAKDLKIKAESVIRLMDRGYRVKCMAMGKGKEDEEEDLGGLLSRLTGLIEDVSVVESGPRVERKQAYVIVRHVKFGPSKKGGGKTSKVVGGTMTEPPTKSVTDRQRPMLPLDDSMESVLESDDEIVSDEDYLPTSSPMKMQDENVVDKKTAWSVSDSSDDFDKLFSLNGGVSSNLTRKEVQATQQRVSSPLNDYASKILHHKPVVNPGPPNTSPYSRPQTSLGTDNRYKRSEPRNLHPPARSMEHMGKSIRESVRSEPQFPYPRRQPPQDVHQSTRELVRSEPQFPYPLQQPPQNMNASSSVRDKKKVNNDDSLFRNSKPPFNELPKQQPSHSEVPDTPAPSFGIFSTPKANSSDKQGIAADAHGNNEGNRYGMGRNGASQNLSGSKFYCNRRPDIDTGGQDRFGIFSRDKSSTTTNGMPKPN